VKYTTKEIVMSMAQKYLENLLERNKEKLRLALEQADIFLKDNAPISEISAALEQASYWQRRCECVMESIEDFKESSEESRL
jgi:hypothetical protein